MEEFLDSGRVTQKGNYHLESLSVSILRLPYTPWHSWFVKVSLIDCLCNDWWKIILQDYTLCALCDWNTYSDDPQFCSSQVYSVMSTYKRVRPGPRGWFCGCLRGSDVDFLGRGLWDIGDVVDKQTSNGYSDFLVVYFVLYTEMSGNCNCHMWEDKLSPYVVKRNIASLSSLHSPRHCLPKVPVQVEDARKKSGTGEKRRRKPQSHLGTELQVLYSSILLKAPPVFIYTTSASSLGDKCCCSSSTDVWWQRES